MARRFVVLKIRHEGCWVQDLTARFPDVRVESRGVQAVNGAIEVDVLVYAKDEALLDAALAEPVPDDVHREVVRRGAEHAEVYSRYSTDRSLYTAVGEAGFLVVGPVVHARGEETWEVLADPTTLDAGVKRLREVADVQVVRISDRDGGGDVVGPGDGLIRALDARISERQLDVLLRAARAGYFDWPRGKGPKELAAELGISTPTCLEHIRRAEGILVPALLEEIRVLRARRRRPGP